MSIEILLITVVLVAMLYLWHLDRSGDSERDEGADGRERRIQKLERLLDERDVEIEQLDAVTKIQRRQIEYLARELRNQPERRPKVTPSQQPAIEQADPEPVAQPAQQPEPVELDSEAKRAEAKRLRSTGMIYREIGQALGVSPMTAHRWCNDDRQRDPEPEQTPEPEPEQATQTELALERARKRSKRQRKIDRNTRPQIVQNAQMLHADGVSLAKIARVLRISPRSASRYVHGTYTSEARAAEYERRRQRGDDDSNDGEQA